MIIDLLLYTLSGVLTVLLFPLQGINIFVDFLSGIPFIMQFFNIIAFILPWSNFVPLFAIIIGIILFKIAISTIKTLWNLLPIL